MLGPAFVGAGHAPLAVDEQQGRLFSLGTCRFLGVANRRSPLPMRLGD